MAESLGDFRYKGTNILAARLTRKKTGNQNNQRIGESLVTRLFDALCEFCEFDDRNRPDRLF